MNQLDPMNSAVPASLAPPTAGQDPLSQLHDIHLPDAVGLWPLAWGWWLLIFVSVLTIALAVFFILRKRSRNAYRAPAIAELNMALSKYSAEQNSLYLQTLSSILRRCAISGHGEHFNTNIKGNEWLSWLDSHCVEAKQQFSKGIGNVLLIGQYQKNPEFDRSTLHQLALLWIREHRNQWQSSAKAPKDVSSEVSHNV